MGNATSNFEVLKNLYFYHGHKPSYFYFSSLINYRNDNEQYNTKADEVYQIGYDALTNGFLDASEANESDSDAMASLQRVMNTLQKAIEYEKKNELAYFQQKYALLKANFNSKEFLSIKEIRELEELFSSPDKFEYDKFLVLINSLIQGFGNTKAIVDYEKNRLKEVSEGINNITTTYGRRLIGLAKKMGMYDKNLNMLDMTGEAFFNRNMKKTQHQIELTYLEHGQLHGTKKVRRRQADGTYKKVTTEKFSGVKKYLDSIRGTVEVEIAHWITNEVSRIVKDKDILEQLTSFITNWYIKNIDNDAAKINEIESEIKGVIIKSLLEYGRTHIPEILSNTYNKMSIDDITNILSSSMNEVFSYDIEGLYNNIGQMGLTLDLFKNAKNIKDLSEASAEQLYEAHKRMREWFSKNKNKITPEQKYTARALNIGTKKDDDYNELMQMINDLELLQKRYEEAIADNQDTVKAVRRASPKSDQGAKWTLNIELVNGQISQDSFKQLKKEVMKADPYNIFIRYASDLSAQSLQGLIQGLKTRVSHHMKTDIISAVETLSKGDKTKEGGIIAKLRDGLQHMYISIGGPTVQEFSQGILESGTAGILSQHRAGPANRKNDFVTISIQYDEKLIGKIVAEDITNPSTVEMLNQTIANSQDELKQSYAKEFSTYFYKELEKLNKKSNFEHNSYKKNAEIFFDFINRQNKTFTQLNEECSKTAKQWQEYREDMLLAGSSIEELNEERKQILESLKNSFFVSSTMKTYNQYQNQIGFKGGSIGANLNEQLSNLQDLFEQAGAPISKSDFDWLKSAIINCSPYSITGEANKNIIENYLGALAAFTVFDEGFAELQILKELENPSSTIINSSPNILHIYSVNGVYIPGSYVLQEVYNHLSNCLNLMDLALQNVNHQGAGIIILNKMTESGIPNRGSETIEDSHPWETIGYRAQHNVSLKVVFLGGLMEILNRMNDVMSQIELPT